MKTNKLDFFDSKNIDICLADDPSKSGNLSMSKDRQTHVNFSEHFFEEDEIEVLELKNSEERYNDSYFLHKNNVVGNIVFPEYITINYCENPKEILFEMTGFSKWIGNDNFWDWNEKRSSLKK